MFSLSQRTLEASGMTADTVVSGSARMQAKKLVFTFLFCNSDVFLISPRPTSSYVGKNPQEQSTEQHYSWEASSSFVRSFHTETNKENIMCDTQKHPSGAVDFSARRKGKKTIQPEFTFLQCTDGSLNAPKHVHHAQFWHLPEQNQILASRRENDRNGGGRISCRRQSCATLFALARCLFIYVNLQPFFTVRGHPLESLFQKEICLNFDENCHVTSLS